MATIAWVTTCLPRAVVRVSAPGGYCSGAVVAPEWVLTCGHFLRGRAAGELKVLIDDLPHRVQSYQRFSGTDVAVMRLTRPTQAPPLALGPAPRAGAHTVTFGFGQRAVAPAARPGRFLGTLPVAFSRGLETVVRPAGLAYTSPPAVKGDSGGPVLARGRVVGVQSLILDPFGVNLRIATVSLLPPEALSPGWPR